MQFVISIFFVTVYFITFSSSAQIVKIPYGNNVKIDGNLDEIEWANALHEEFVGGELILFQHDLKFLYLGIRGEKGGFASVCLFNEDTVYVLHSSLGLITAKYVRDNNQWRQIHEFRSEAQSKIGKIQNIDHQMELSLKEYGWFANTLNFSNSNDDEKEYILSLKKLKRGKSKISIVFFQHAGSIQFAHAPKGLADGSLNSELVRGGNVKFLSFDPNSWITIDW